MNADSYCDFDYNKFKNLKISNAYGKIVLTKNNNYKSNKKLSNLICLEPISFLKNFGVIIYLEKGLYNICSYEECSVSSNTKCGLFNKKDGTPK